MIQQKIYVAGHTGMVGSSIVRCLLAEGVISSEIITRTHTELDLTNQEAVKNFFISEKPTQVYLAAAKVGGIHANNNYPADFIYENLMIQSNVIEAAFINGVQKLLFLGSSCIYPRLSEQPINEKDLLTSSLEPTNEAYAIAKIAGIKMCESYNRQYGESHSVDYRSLIPTNLYGPGDYYHSENSHVIPALISRFHEAKIKKTPLVTIWGSGLPKREFLYVDDMATACIHLMKLEKSIYKSHTDLRASHINVGWGHDISIKELSEEIAKTIGYKGVVTFDANKPDGAPRKLLNSSILKSLGWKPKVKLSEGLDLAYKDFLINYSTIK